MKRRRNVLGLAVAGAAALCLPAYVIHILAGGGGGGGDYEDDEEMMEREEEEIRMHRLLQTLDDPAPPDDESLFSVPDWLSSVEHIEDEAVIDASLHLALDEAVSSRKASAASRLESLPSYNILDPIRSSNLFEATYAIVVYDNLEDEFLFLYTRNMRWLQGANAKLRIVLVNFVYLLRRTFPDRFCGKECDELAIGVNSGDYPHLHSECLTPSNCIEYKDTPTLQFGSVFRNPAILPNMIAMPMPISNGLKCFVIFGGSDKSQVCTGLKSPDETTNKERRMSKTTEGRLVYGEEATPDVWEGLIPQVVWRGTNFLYVGHLNNLRMPSIISDLRSVAFSKIEDPMERKAAATQALRKSYNRLLPRWKGVVWTAEAELEVQEKMRDDANENYDDAQSSLPWANIKFMAHMDKYKKLASDYDIPAMGEHLSLADLSRYRYHLDIGGGGGTTWSGTVQKLALPGLLFHHVTPTKDYVHDRMVPWVHHVPVREDLTDLRVRFDWAEAHPAAARSIARKGTELMRRIGTVEGFGEMYEEVFVEPLRRVVEAYEPVSTTHPGMTWRDVIKSNSDDLPGLYVREKCQGNHSGKVGCEWFGEAAIE